MKKLVFLLAFCAMGQVPLSYTPYQILDARSGQAIACVACQVFTYAAGTTTPIATYTDHTLSTANSNPVLTNSAGYAVDGSTITGIWGASGTCYKVVVQDASSVTIYTQDYLCLPPGINSFAAPVTISGSSGTVLAITASGAAVGLAVSGPATITGTSITPALLLANPSGPALTVSNAAVFNGTTTLNGATTASAAVTLNSGLTVNTCTGCWPGASVFADGNILYTAGLIPGNPGTLTQMAGSNAITVSSSDPGLVVAISNDSDSIFRASNSGIGSGATITNSSSINPAIIIGNSGSGEGAEIESAGVGAVLLMSNSNGSCTITPTTASVNCSSDKRLKNYIQSLPNSLDVVRKLRAVLFAWRKDPQHTKHPGFLAQEVQKIVPGLVETGEDGYLRLNEMAMIPYLVGAVQEEDRTIHALWVGIGILIVWSTILTFKVFRV